MRRWLAALLTLVMGATMAIAPLWDEFDGGEGDPLGELFPGGGSPAAGQPFLTSKLGSQARIIVEAAFGADLDAEPATWQWWDITTDVRQADGQRISIAPMGRADESSQAQPAGCSFQLDNTSGAYSKDHPGSVWYPNIQRNTPIRVSVSLTGYSADKVVRFQGYANGWVPSWDTSARVAVVTVSASGILRRLNQGTNPLRSALYRAISRSSPAPLGYWPLEDGTSATQAASGLTGGTALALTGSVKFANVDGPAGSGKVADFSTGGSLTGALAGSGTTTSWRVEAWVKFSSTLGVNDSNVIRVISGSGSIAQWEIHVNNVAAVGQGVYLDYVFAGGAEILQASAFGVDDNSWHQIRLDATQSGANIVMTVKVDGTTRLTVTETSATLGALSSVAINPEESTTMPAVGHVAVWEPFASTVDTYNAGTGYVGETATDRLTRLCAEEGEPITITGSSDMAMGAQGVATFITLLRECETTDDGLLYDGLGAGLGYIARTARYNIAASLSPDVTADPPQVDDPFSPADDDQRNRNLVKVDRKNGSSATYEDSTGPLGTGEIKQYDSSVTVNAEDDSGLLFRAGHEVKKGTVPGFRYPKLYLNLAATPSLAAAWLSTPLAGRVDVLNVSSRATQHPPGTVSLLIEGYEEQLSPYAWAVGLNCSPFEPWRVAVVEGAGDTGWRVEAGASTLSADAAAGATSLTVATSDGYPWSTSAGDYPRDINVGGVQVTVSAVSGSSSPQTFTVSALPYAVRGGWQITLWRNPKIAL